jgi:hypothetical protein
MSLAPLKPMFEEFEVTRLREGAFAPVGVAPSWPGESAPAAVAPVVWTPSKSTLIVL